MCRAAGSSAEFHSDHQLDCLCSLTAEMVMQYLFYSGLKCIVSKENCTKARAHTHKLWRTTHVAAGRRPQWCPGPVWPVRTKGQFTWSHLMREPSSIAAPWHGDIFPEGHAVTCWHLGRAGREEAGVWIQIVRTCVYTCECVCVLCANDALYFLFSEMMFVFTKRQIWNKYLDSIFIIN